ncbi:HAD family hydrolase [Pendulispora albinea]|uniref:phosphoglycolate phosphatase n=1 Tax=Pendulispora albinea TaxID=2741071 RepID=A0ABZ2LJB4_9BACT
MSSVRLATPDAVLFDLDGTLIDSCADIAAACNHALVTHGRAALAGETIRTYVGDGARVLLARAFGLPRESTELDAPLAAFHAYYRAHPVDQTTLLPGARASLDALRDRKRILATNKPRDTTLLVLEGLGLLGDFDAIRGGGDGPLKPHPFTLLSALEEVGVAPARAWMVGDGPQDVGAGKAAACGATIGVLDGFVTRERLYAAEPDVVLGSLDELVPLLSSAM